MSRRQKDQLRPLTDDERTTARAARHESAGQAGAARYNQLGTRHGMPSS